MSCPKFLFLLIFFSNFAFAGSYDKFEKQTGVRVVNSNKSISKIIFNMSEVVSSETNVPMSISFEKDENIVAKVRSNEKIDLIIVDNYDILKELKELDLINFSYVATLFYDRLVYVPLFRKEKFEDLKMPENQAIFFKTSVEDKDVTNNDAEKVPSVLLKSSNICKTVNSFRILYENTYQYMIIKESVAKKCDLQFSGFFNNLYNLYYVAIVNNGNFKQTKKTFDFLENSKKIKEIIKNNGYNS